jgi:adenine-specific DNA-methyltransferase
MAKNGSALEQLKSFLNELFQFDSQDLDFGVYKILHYKRKEIKDFIDKLLVDKVQEQLQTLTTEEGKRAMQQLKDLEKEEFIRGWIKASEEERKIGEKMAGTKVAEYRKIKTLVDEIRVADGTENHIYNHLTLFFSRYYDKGDFISKRRFGKNEKYMVPYNGEETHFYWANHDQYYIKSSETFQQYAFKITTPRDNMAVNFKLTSAQVEQGNVKADEPNFFILSEKEAEIGEKETHFFFEYRPLTDDEKKTFKGNNKQDVLDERAFEALKNKYGKEVNLVKLWETDKDDKALLLKKLNHYTRKNKYDFFIHKNLKGFLQRELDYYIKSELINVDDLYVSEVDSYFDRLKHNVKSIKVFKTIADTIIEFVSQIEDFQKKLWEKKKFVLSTEWVITIDRLVEYIGEEAAKPIVEEVIKNEKQVAEWKELFGEENVPKKLSVDTLKADLHSWRKLPIDTVHYSKDFKLDLLNELSEKIELEKKADGLNINADNYHALNLLQTKYYQLIQGIFIDPPYNTGNDVGFVYKDSFQHSTWLSFLESRLSFINDLLSSDRLFFTTLDDVEQANYKLLVNKLLGEKCFVANITWWRRHGRNNNAKTFSDVKDHLIVYKLSDSLKEIREEKNGKQKGYSNPDNDERGDWTSISYVNPATKSERPNLVYKIQNPFTKKWVEHETNAWKYSKSENDRHIKENRLYWGSDGGNTYPRLKLFLTETETMVPMDVWDQDYAGTTDSGSRLLNNLFPKKPFNNPKPPKVVEKAIRLRPNRDKLKDSVFLDFFAGSGTTFHAVQLMNTEELNNKCILVEQGEYFHDIIIPRIKKIAYTFDWKDGKPKNGSMNGLGVFFKYQRLEQYEEALENIAFTANKDAQQQALEFDQYIPKYMLEFETKNSQTLVNTEAMKDPWDYKLKVWDGFTYDTEQAVDLVETFNYLIGLHMQKCITKELNGRKYQFVYGHNNANKNILAVWRSVKDWKLEDYSKDREVLSKELESYSFDILYINEQAHLPEKYTYQSIEEVFKNIMLP